MVSITQVGLSFASTVQLLTFEKLDVDNTLMDHAIGVDIVTLCT